MIKDAEDKGLITPGKVGNENSPYLEFVFFKGLSYRFCTFQIFLCWLIIRIEPQINYIPTIASMMAPVWLFH
jgi:hypothetical protein